MRRLYSLPFMLSLQQGSCIDGRAFLERLDDIAVLVLKVHAATSASTTFKVCSIEAGGALRSTGCFTVSGAATELDHECLVEVDGCTGCVLEGTDGVAAALDVSVCRGLDDYGAAVVWLLDVYERGVATDFVSYLIICLALLEEENLGWGIVKVFVPSLGACEALAWKDVFALVDDTVGVACAITCNGDRALFALVICAESEGIASLDSLKIC